MHITSLIPDVQLYLLNMIEPIDRFNFILSGALPGFQGLIDSIDTTQRIPYFEVDIRLQRNAFLQFEIRCLAIPCFIDHELSVNYYELSISAQDLLATLLRGGYLANLQQLTIKNDWPSNVHLFEQYLPTNVIRKLIIDQFYQPIAFPSDVRRLFSCYPQVTELEMAPCNLTTCNLNPAVANALRTRFQQLQSFNLRACINRSAWPLLQQMVTWITACTDLQLHCRYGQYDYATPINTALKSDTGLPQQLRTLILSCNKRAFTRWILGYCTELQTLHLRTSDPPIDTHVLINNLSKLRTLIVSVESTTQLIKIYGPKCPLDNLRIHVNTILLQDFQTLKPNATRLKQLCLKWQSGATVQQILPIIGQWKGLQHLVLETSSFRSESSLNIQQLQTLITNLRELRYLRITGFTATRLQFEHLSIAFTDFLNVHRPSFKFSFVPNIL